MPEKLLLDPDIEEIPEEKTPPFEFLPAHGQPEKPKVPFVYRMAEKGAELAEKIFPKEEVLAEFEKYPLISTRDGRGMPYVDPRALIPIAKQTTKAVARLVAGIPAFYWDVGDAITDPGPERKEKILALAKGFKDMAVKSIAHPIKTFKEEPEALLGTILIIGGYKSKMGKKIVDRAENYWKENIGEPGAEFLNQITPKVVKKYFYGRLARDPELKNILFRAEGERAELRQELGKTVKATEQLKELVPAQGVFKQKVELPTGETKEIPIRREELRARQLLTQTTIPFGKLPKGKEIQKAGITSDIEAQKLADFVKDFEIQLGAEAVAQGLLPPESFLKNSGAHLYRAYEKHLKRKGIRGLFPYKPLSVQLGEFKRRGLGAIKREESRLEKEINPLQKNVEFLEKRLDQSIKKNKDRLQQLLYRQKGKEIPTQIATPEDISVSPEAIGRVKTEKALGITREKVNLITKTKESIPITVEAIDIKPTENEVIVTHRSGRILDLRSGTGKPLTDPQRATIRKIIEPVVTKEDIQAIKKLKVSQLEEPTIVAIQKRIVELERLKETAGQRIDYDFKEQLAMGLDLDPAVSVAIGGSKVINDISHFQAMSEILKNPKWTSTVPKENWVQFGKPANLTAERWRNLTGLKADQKVYIEPETYIDAFDFVASKPAWVKSYGAWRAFFSKALTTKNPFFMLVNTMGNLSFSDMAKANTRRYVKNLFTPDTEYAKYKQILLKEGRLGDVSVEVDLSKFLPELREDTPIGMQIPLILDKITDYMVRGKDQQKFNVKIDQDLKIEVYRSQIEKGISHQEALKFVDETTPSPAHLPKFWKALRDVGFPSLFVSFPIETARVMKNHAKNRPTALLKWVALPLILKEIFQEQQNISNDELDAAYKQLPGYRKGLLNTMIPIREKDGTVAFIDISNLLPWTSFTQMTGNYRGITSNPIFNLIFKVSTGRDPQTGKEIIKPEETSFGMELKEWTDEVFKTFPQYRQAKGLLDFYQGKKMVTGREREPEEIASLFIPIKYIRFAEEDVAFQLNLLQSKAQDIQNRKYAIGRDLALERISQKDAERKVQNLEKELLEIQQEMEKLYMLFPQKQEIPVVPDITETPKPQGD